MRFLLVGLVIVVSSLAAVGAAAQAPANGATFVVRVDSEGAFFLPGDVASADEATVVAQAAAALSREADVALVVEADTSAPYQSVTRAAVLLQEAGGKKISFRTRNADQERLP